MAMDNKNTVQNKETKSTNEKHTTRNILIIGGIIIIVVLLLLLRSCAGSGPADDKHQLSAGDGIVTTEELERMTPEEIQAMLNEQAAKGYITISMNPRPTFADGTADGNLLISNAAHTYKLLMDGKNIAKAEGLDDAVFEFTYDGHAYKAEAAVFNDIDGSISIKSEDGAAEIVFDADGNYTYGSKKGTYTFSYEMGNYYDQVVEIYMKKDDGTAGDLIYTSPVIPVGSYVHYDALDVDLDAGEYPCVACFYLVDADLNIIGQGNAEILITVEK